MKHLKTYKLFEELESVDRGYIFALQDNFKSDIIDICLDLDDILPVSISFDDYKYRSTNLNRSDDPGKSIWESNYPSITISPEGRFRGIDATLPSKSGKGTGHFNKKIIEDWNKECISTANRIKSYLGDNFLLFTIIDKGDERSFQLDNLTKPSSFGPFPRLNIETLRQGHIRMFRIIFNPDPYDKPLLRYD